MSVVAAAIVGSAVVGGLSSASASGNAADAANASTAASAAASAAQLEFSKEQYADWEKVYGPIQDNLSAYYKDLTPATIEAAGIQNINQQYAQANKSITQSLAQRGISSSGLEGQAIVDLAQKQAQDTANLKIQAPMMAAQEKMKFLSLGMGQGANAVAGVQNAYGTQATLAANQANMYNQQAASSAAGVGSSLSSGVNSYMSYNAMNQQNALLQSALGAGVYPAASLGGTQSIWPLP